MYDEFNKRLNDYLNSECSDYDMSFMIEFEEEMYYNFCSVKIMRENYSKFIYFKYDENNNELLIELTNSSYYVTREYDETVKYFWMLVAPALFPEV